MVKWQFKMLVIFQCFSLKPKLQTTVKSQQIRTHTQSDSEPLNDEVMCHSTATRWHCEAAASSGLVELM